MQDLLTFRTMLTPVLIRALFWVGSILCVATGVGVMLGVVDWGSMPQTPRAETWVGLALILLGPVVVRVYCEVWILFFRMNETLTDIARSLHAARRASR